MGLVEVPTAQQHKRPFNAEQHLHPAEHKETFLLTKKIQKTAFCKKKWHHAVYLEESLFWNLLLTMTQPVETS